MTPSVPENPTVDPDKPYEDDIIARLDEEFKKLKKEIADANSEIERLKAIIAKAKGDLDEA